jgi:dethiobiotin synthetase
VAQSEGTLFIEGVGGVMVPLDDTRTVLDWTAALDLPLIVVTGS